MRKKTAPLAVLDQQFEDLSVEMFRRFKQLIRVDMGATNKAVDVGVASALPRE